METRSTTHSHPLSTSTRAVLAPVEWAEKWIRTALIALPLYGALLFSGTLTHQPDYKTQFRDYAEYITTNRFIVDHLVVSILGIAVAMIGVLALAAPAHRRRWLDRSSTLARTSTRPLVEKTP